MEEKIKDYPGITPEITKEEIIYRLVQDGKITLWEFLVLIKDTKEPESNPVPWYPVYPNNPYPWDNGGIIYTNTPNYVNRT